MNCPSSFEVQLAKNEIGKIVTWNEPKFTDNVKIDNVHKTKVSIQIKADAIEL